MCSVVRVFDYIDIIRSESARFASLTRDVAKSSQVPSCPGWSISDLVWHLAEVQYFWASVVEGQLDSPESVATLERPDDTELSSLFDMQSARLLAALHARSPDDTCWSWYDAGHSVGWVMRRQAHEALIHRVDAELAAGKLTPLDEDLAADGVDEILTTMLDTGDIPDWSRFEPSGATAVLATPTNRWEMDLGRFTGTSPSSGTTYDDPALLLRPIRETASVMITGSAADLDLWLWGRGSADDLEVTGDSALLDDIRAAAAAATQ